MVSEALVTVFRFSPIIFFAVAYFVVHFRGKGKTEEAVTRRIGALVKVLGEHQVAVGEPNSETIERYRLPLSVVNLPKVKAAAAWLEMWPRRSLIHVGTSFMFHPNDHFSATMNLGTKDTVWPPNLILELIPYKKKMTIRKYFDYLVQMDDIDTGDPELDDAFLIKSDDQRIARGYFKNEQVLARLKKVAPYLDYLTLRSEEPHLECKWAFPSTLEDLRGIFEFIIKLAEEFARPRKTSKKKKRTRKATN